MQPVACWKPAEIFGSLLESFGRLAAEKFRQAAENLGRFPTSYRLHLPELVSGAAGVKGGKHLSAPFEHKEKVPFKPTLGVLVAIEIFNWTGLSRLLNLIIRIFALQKIGFFFWPQTHISKILVILLKDYRPAETYGL